MVLWSQATGQDLEGVRILGKMLPEMWTSLWLVPVLSHWTAIIITTVIYYNKRRIANANTWYPLKVSLPKKRLFSEDSLPAPYILSVLRVPQHPRMSEREYSTSQPSLTVYYCLSSVTRPCPISAKWLSPSHYSQYIITGWNNLENVC